MARRVRTRASGVEVTARALRTKAKRSDVSRQVEQEDVFADTALSSIILAPPYSPTLIASVYEKSNMLSQCVDAMVTNIAKLGARVVPIQKDVSMDPKEKELLESFIESANTEESLSGVKARSVHDYEKYGYMFLEVVRNAKGSPSLLKYASVYHTRLMKRDPEPVLTTTSITRGGSRSLIRELKKFRRYVQQIGNAKVYFKEFGDPRDMDYTNGRYAEEGYKVPKNRRATEILHCKQHSEDSYGTPRWISQIPSILGSREAEEVNLRYFEDNTVPPMIMSVSGGKLTRQSFADLNKLLNAEGVGRDRQNQILLVEAIPETTGLDEKGTVSVKIDKLTDSRPSDALFGAYDDANINKIRSSFRLPPVAVGASQDVTFATANVSAFLAESQVYQPERMSHDEFMNKRFVNHPRGLNLKTVKLQSKGPAVTNPDQIIKTLTAINPMGGVTPRSAIAIVNETMQLSLPQYPEPGTEGYEVWMDEPMPLSQRKQGTQQTGEGDHLQSEQSGKDQDTKDREVDGETTPEPVEHGQE